MGKRHDEVELIVKESDKEMTQEDRNFIVNMLCRWGIRDYLEKNKQNESTLNR